jgi:RimJ/RimL family protein N-acetyltransferase
MFVFDSERVGNWVTEKAGGNYTHLCTAIGYEQDGQLIAGVMYDGFTGKKGESGGSISMHSRIDARVPREFYWLVFAYPFDQLQVKNVRGIVRSNNSKAIKLNNHLGFRREALLRDYFQDSDAIIFCMSKEDCRFLGSKYVRFTQTA